MHTPKTRHQKIRHSPDEPDRFAELMHSIILSFGRIRAEVSTENAAVRAEWRQARGLATWTEERLEVLEARLQRLEQHTGLPPDPEVERLRAILANWRPAAGAIGVKPLRGSMMGPGSHTI